MFFWFYMFTLSMISCKQIKDSIDVKNCELDATYEAYLQQNFQNFKDGISEQALLQYSKKAIKKCEIWIKDHQVVYKDCLEDRFSLKFEMMIDELSELLPDIKFVVNFKDQPAVLKHKCRGALQKINCNQPRACFCDQQFRIHNTLRHSYFDLPLQPQNIYQKIIPIFSPAIISQCTYDILVPSEYHLRQQSDFKHIPWENKRFNAIWRGRLTDLHSFAQQQRNFDLKSRSHRLGLVNACLTIKDCDAKLTHYNTRQKDYQNLSKQYELAERLTYTQMSQNKIIIDIDGSTYSERLPNLLKSGSVVFKINTFDDIGSIGIKPWEHYVPIRMDLSDLEQKLQWARQNDHKIKLIAQRGRKRSLELHNKKMYYCYFKKAILKMHSLMNKWKQINQIKNIEKQRIFP